MVQHSAIDHTGILGVGSGTGGIVASDINLYTGGDIALSSTTLAAVPGLTDLVVAASAGDLVMLGLVARSASTGGQSMAFDFATMVGGSPVNYVFPASGTPVNIPTAWYIGAASPDSTQGGFPYVVQAGDISAGNVTFRLYGRVSGARSLEADASAPLVTWAVNHGQ